MNYHEFWGMHFKPISIFFLGICSASYGSAAPLYVSEISSPKIRGRLVCTFDTMIAAGMVFMLAQIIMRRFFCDKFIEILNFCRNIVGSFTSWRVQAFVCGCVPVVAHVMLLMSKESPRYYLAVDNYKEAKATLEWFNPTASNEHITKQVDEVSSWKFLHHFVQKWWKIPFLQIAECAEQDRYNNTFYGWRTILGRDVYKPILIGIMLMFFHLMSGNYPILAYGMTSVGIDTNIDVTPNYLGITLMNLAQFVSQ